MKQEEFDVLFTGWKEHLAINCDHLAKNPNFDLDLDFYAFQSSVRQCPPLLIIGTNPGGEMTYSEMNKINHRQGRSSSDLGDGDVNQFLANPDWKISRSFLSLFSTDKLRSMFEQAVITNLVYFNTGKFSDFTSKKGAKDAIEFCAYSNRRLIRILQPTNILLLGNHAPKYLSPYFDKPMVDILRSCDNRSALIRQTAIDGIPTFWMCHPSSRQGFWNSENLLMKREMIENVLFY